MWTHLLAIVALSLLCALWVVFQRWIARHDPHAPGVEGKCSSCSGGCTDDPR